MVASGAPDRIFSARARRSSRSPARACVVSHPCRGSRDRRGPLSCRSLSSRRTAAFLDDRRWGRCATWPRTQGVSGELHILYGGGAGGVVLEGLDLVAPGFRDHGYDHGSAKGFLAFAADPAGGHLFAFPLGLGL